MKDEDGTMPVSHTAPALKSDDDGYPLPGISHYGGA